MARAFAAVVEHMFAASGGRPPCVRACGQSEKRGCAAPGHRPFPGGAALPVRPLEPHAAGQLGLKMMMQFCPLW